LNRPAVSIILPYRDASKTILRCIKSIQSQTLENWELLAINDQSTDTTENDIRSLASDDPRVKYSHTKKTGIVSALNLGVEGATSDLFARMDSDDVMHPLRLEKQVNFLARHPGVGVIASKVCYKINPGESYGEGFAEYVKWSNSIQREHEISFHRFEESPIVHPSVVFRKMLFKNYGGYRDGPFPEDYELWLRWQSRGVRFCKLKDILLDWYDSENRASRIEIRYSKPSFQRAKAKYLKAWLDEHQHHQKKLIGWGAGKIAKAQIRILIENNILLEKIYEVDPKKIGTHFAGIPILDVRELNLQSTEFMLVLTGSRSAKNKIKDFLGVRNLVYGKHYLFFA
tara:strand:- start:399 stop:1424 length:1026 start_codon:yes stop_codon:yes gene_type:complete